MAKKKDHYVAQAYLKNFSVPGKPGRVNVIHKSTLQRRDSIPVHSVCSAKDWSTIAQFSPNERAVEDYLAAYESAWTPSLAVLRADNFDYETKVKMAGYIAYLRACTPTAARLAAAGYVEIIKATWQTAERQEFEKANQDLQEKLTQSGLRGIPPEIQVKEDYVKAMGVAALQRSHERLVGFRWIILKNKTSVPFVTSDNPVCLNLSAAI